METPLTPLSSDSSDTPATPTPHPLLSWISTHRLASAMIGFLFVAMISGGIFLGLGGSAPSISSIISRVSGVPVVSGANFSLENRQIPFDTPSIDITFSEPIDPLSLSGGSVLSIVPALQGVATISGSTLSYRLDAPMTLGETYTISVDSGLRARNGKSLTENYEIDLQATDRAHATAIFPSGRLDDLGRPITILWNIPMIPLTNLDEKDKLPCPIQITPQISGKCQWTNGSILEFIPDEPLRGATRYRVETQTASGLLFPVSTSTGVEIITTPLRVSSDGEFEAMSGIVLTTNAPVALEEIQKKISLESLSTEDKTPKKLTLSITAIRENTDSGSVISESRYLIQPSTGTLSYQTIYRLRVEKGLAPKYGNIPTESEITMNLRSRPIMTGKSIYQKIFSATGLLIDTREFSLNNGQKYIPARDLFFRLSFSREIPLDAKLLTLESASGVSIPVDLSYVKTTDEAGKALEDHTMIDITPRSPLSFSTQYRVVFSRSYSPAMSRDDEVIYTVAPAPSIAAVEPLSNTELCIWSRSELSYEVAGISTRPTASVRSLMRDEQYDWKDGQQIITHKCLQKKDHTSYILDTRLAPLRDYQIVFGSGWTDSYGSRLSGEKSFSIRSQATQEKDKYLYSSLDGETQLVPAGLPLTMGLRSTNIDSVRLEACGMTIEEYITYIQRQSHDGFPTPSCQDRVEKKISVKNAFWSLSSTFLDIEKEIWSGATLTHPFVFVRGTTREWNMNNGYPDSQREFSHLFIRSSLSMVVERAANKNILFVTTMDGKETPSDLTFQTYRSSEVGPVLSPTSVKWNSEKKYYEYSDPKGSQVAIIIARGKNTFGVINLMNDQTSNYDFKYISGMDSSTREYLYLSTDRPLYRVGDTVFYKGILRDFYPEGYRLSQVKGGTLRILDDQNTLLMEQPVTVDRESTINGKFTLPREMPLGRYHFELMTGENNQNSIYNSAEFFVDAYQKPTFRVGLSVDGTEKMLGQSGSITSNTEYYFGGKVATANYSLSVLSQNYYFSTAEYGDYQFGEGSAYSDCYYWGSCSYDDSLELSITGSLDSSGTMRYTHLYEKGSGDEKKGEKIYTYTLTVTDPDTQKDISESKSQVVHTTDGYVGIRAPYWTTVKDGISLEGVILDRSGKIKSGAPVKLLLSRIEYKEIKKQGVDGVFYYEMSREIRKVTEKSVTSDQNGEFREKFSALKEGEYEIKALYTGANGMTFVSSREVSVSGEANIWWNQGNNSVTDLTADKTMLQIGDTAHLTLKSPVANGKLLITLAKDDGILDAWVTDITTTTPRIEFLVKKEYIPNVYVKVFLIGKDPKNPLPIYKRALSVIKVTPDPKKLSVTITPEKSQYLPGEKIKLTVSVKDSAGKGVAGANGSLSIVDQSLLALMGNPMKNPFAFFYDMKRYLGVETSVSLVHLIEKLEVKDTSGGEKGGAGDGQKGGSSKKKRGVFKDTAFWQANFTTDADGTSTITTDPLPDNLTTWVVESIVSTRATDIGIAQTQIMTTKRVVIEPNLPRFLSSDGEITLLPVIHNKTEKDQTFLITLSGSQMQIDQPTQTITLRSGASVGVPFLAHPNLSAQTGALASHISIRAVAQTSGDLDEIEQILPITLSRTPETVATIGRVETSRDEKIVLSDTIRSAGGRVDISWSASPMPTLLSGIDFLTHFPYGCSEQRTSAIMPAVYAKSLYTSIDLPYDLREKKIQRYIDSFTGYQDVSLDESIREYLASIGSYQRSDGGFGYWTDSESSDLALSTRMASAFSELSDIGYTPDRQMTDGLQKYLETRLSDRLTQPREKKNISELLALLDALIELDTGYTDALARYTQITSGLSQDHLDSLREIRLRVVARMISSAKISESERSGLRKAAQTIVTEILSHGLILNPRGAFIGSGSPQDRLMESSRFMHSIALIGVEHFSTHRQALDQILAWILSEKGRDGSWGSTDTTNTVIRAVTAWMQSSGDLKGVDMTASLSLDTRVIDQHRVEKKNKLDTFQKTLTLDQLQSSSLLHMERTGSGRMYYDIGLTYSIPALSTPARDAGFFVQQEYYDYESYKQISRAKEKEYREYLDAKRSYESLEYPKSVISYLTPLTEWRVGKLVYVSTRLITPESRDQAAFEAMIPAGSELVNTALKTEDQSNRLDSFWSHTEYQDDRYFATTDTLAPGVYQFGYIIRPTHSGSFPLLPARAFEFYTPEVFGRTAGRAVKIIK